MSVAGSIEEREAIKKNLKRDKATKARREKIMLAKPITIKSLYDDEKKANIERFRSSQPNPVLDDGKNKKLRVKNEVNFF